MWLAVTSILAAKSGWYRLMRQYPDRNEGPVLVLRFQSGRLGGVSMSRILRLTPCPSGLRVGIWKLFGPFSKDFFVPWDEIRIERRSRFIFKVADLRFGNGVGKLSLFGHVADRLARSVPGHWPEAGPFPEETKSQALWEVLKIWAVGTIFAALFFIVVPMLAAPKGGRPPIAVAILFPAIVLGVRALFSYFARIKRDTF
jgi:hypothetical protein